MTGNTFSSGPTGYFGVSVHFSQRWGMILIIDLQYAIGMASHVNATVTGNDARGANFGSIESWSCFTVNFPSDQYISQNFTDLQL